MQYGRYVVPCRFIGQNSKRFYRVDRLGKLIGVNLAMALLPDELYKAQGSTLKMIIGEPVPFDYFDSSRRPMEWAAEVRKMCYSLGEK